jgi:hypothetical protein
VIVAIAVSGSVITGPVPALGPQLWQHPPVAALGSRVSMELPTRGAPGG